MGHQCQCLYLGEDRGDCGPGDDDDGGGGDDHGHREHSSFQSPWHQQSPGPGTQSDAPISTGHL